MVSKGIRATARWRPGRCLSFAAGAIAALALAGPCLADEGKQAACNDLTRSATRYDVLFWTSSGDLTLTARRDGNTILVDGRWASGAAYALRRRNGYSVAYRKDDRRIDWDYAGVSLDVDVTEARPAQYDVTTTIYTGGVRDKVVRSTTRLTYLGEEAVAVGDCSFATVHFVEEPAAPDADGAVVTTNRWFAPGLNMNLRMTMDRREADGPSRRVFESRAVSISVPTVPDK